MSKFIGRLVTVGVVRETTRGAGASPVYSVPFATFTFDDKIVQARSLGALGSIADSEEAFVTLKYGQGDMDCEMRAKSLGVFLYALLGTYSVAGPTDSAYIHSFTIAETNTHQSLSFVVADSNTTELYKLVMLDSFKLNASLDKVVTVALGFLSKVARDTGLTNPAVVRESKWTKKHVSIKLADSIGALAAASALSIKTLNFNVVKNAKVDDSLGTAEPEDINNQQLAVEGDLDFNYEAETFKNYMLNGTSKAMEIAFTNTDDTIGAATRPSLTIQLPKVDFHSWVPDYGLEKLATQKISFKASKDIANSLNIISTCSLVNDVTTYT